MNDAIKLAIDALEKIAAFDKYEPAGPAAATAQAALAALRAQPANPLECTRSHPHELMDGHCELRTEIARLTNENARLKAQPDHSELVRELRYVADWAKHHLDKAQIINAGADALEGL